MRSRDPRSTGRFPAVVSQVNILEKLSACADGGGHVSVKDPYGIYCREDQETSDFKRL